MATANDTEALHSWLVRIRGRVQGVGYRDACVAHARTIEITGWVRNRSDGSVEATLQGPEDKLRAMTAWLQEGVPGALVSDLEITWLSASSTRYTVFGRVPTL